MDNWVSDWRDVPWGLRLRIQTTNFVFYLFGVIPRMCLFGFGIFSVVEIKYQPVQGIVYLAVCLVLMGLDISLASPARQGVADIRKTLLLKVVDFFLYPIGLAIHALAFSLTAGCAYLVWDHQFVAIIGVAIGLILISVGSQAVTEPKEWLRADHFLVR